MSISRTLLVAAAAALISVAAFAVLTQSQKKASAEPAGELKVAVVNMGEVFNKINERKSREDDLNRRREELQAQLDKMAQQYNALVKQHDELKPDDPKRNELEEQIVQLQSDADSLQKKGVALLAKRQCEDRQGLYAMIRDAIDKYAADHGITLVLKVDDKRVSANPNTQMLEISERGVLYGDKSLDITEEIIKALNKE